MARYALALLFSPGELAAVRIGSVAVRALRKRHGLLEVPACVALYAVHLNVLPKQRELGLGMVELFIRRNLFPAGGGVARFAGLRKRAMMRVSVAVAAFREWYAREAGLAARVSGRMAFCASHLRVKSCERKVRLVVIEFCGCLPINKIVTLLAVLAELPAVRILMARHAVG